MSSAALSGYGRPRVKPRPQSVRDWKIVAIDVVGTAAASLLLGQLAFSVVGDVLARRQIVERNALQQQARHDATRALHDAIQGGYLQHANSYGRRSVNIGTGIPGWQGRKYGSLLVTAEVWRKSVDGCVAYFEYGPLDTCLGNTRLPRHQAGGSICFTF